MPTFGARLKTQREQRGLTLDDISKSTKIGVRSLRALEDEQFDLLPGGIFNKGFIRAYARAVGIDEEQAIADYLSATNPSPGPLQNPSANGGTPKLAEPKLEAPSDRAAGLPWGTFAIVLLLLAVVLAIWGTRFTRSSSEITPAQPSASKSTPTFEEKSTASVEPQPTAAPEVSPSSVTPTSGSNPVARGLALVIEAREESWLSITIDGEVTVQDTLVAPAKKSVTAQKEIVIRAGNVGALDFTLNGKKLPPQGGYNEVKTLTFDAKSLQTSAPKPESTDHQ